MAPVALIAGASGGIGSATALAFAEAGYVMALLYRVAPVLPDGSDHLGLGLDLADPEAVAAAFEHVFRRFGRLDALINIAGIDCKSAIAEMELNDWNRMMDVNVGAMFLTSKHAVPMLAVSGSGAIVNMASISGHVASPHYPAYVATKAAVESFTWALAGEVAGRGNRVNAVAPGWVAAGFTRAALDTAQDPDILLTAARKAHVFGRMAEPTEIAKAILWLASPNASFVAGETLFVDGGLMRVH